MQLCLSYAPHNLELSKKHIYYCLECLLLFRLLDNVPMGWYDYKMKVKRNDVMRLLKAVDPEGASLPKAHTVLCTGPYFLWHVDGYDKLKPFGLCFHGAIDGYGRRMMWLEVRATKNDQNCIANYYPKLLRLLYVFHGLSDGGSGLRLNGCPDIQL